LTKIERILKSVAHRPWPITDESWQFYQEWNEALFLHWKVPFDLLRTYVPADLTIDTFEGNCYVSLVAFTMQNIRPRFLPAFATISDFHEINLRTYIENDSKKGVYFLSIESEKEISTFIARTLSGLPYEKATIERDDNVYSSRNIKKGTHLHIQYSVDHVDTPKTDLDRWLTERYCLYNKTDSGLFRFDIHHEEWKLDKLILNETSINYRIGDFNLAPSTIHCVHYSKGVDVVAWKKVQLA